MIWQQVLNQNPQYSNQDLPYLFM